VKIGTQSALQNIREQRGTTCYIVLTKNIFTPQGHPRATLPHENVLIRRQRARTLFGVHRVFGSGRPPRKPGPV